MSMINNERMKRLLVKNLMTAVSITMKGFAFIAAVSAIVMIPMVFDGEFAFMHVFAMMGIAGAFCVLAAVTEAVQNSVNI